MTDTKKTAVPADAKQPTDRKAKVESLPDEYVTTVKGTEFSVPAAALDDFELLDDLNRSKKDGTAIPSILRRFLGDDQYDAAMDLCRDPETGRVTIEAGATFLSELMEGVNPSS